MVSGVLARTTIMAASILALVLFVAHIFSLI
jgi:hypothetical protein